MTVFGLIQSIFEIFEKLVAPVESFERLGLSLERFGSQIIVLLNE